MYTKQMNLYSLEKGNQELSNKPKITQIESLDIE